MALPVSLATLEPLPRAREEYLSAKADRFLAMAHRRTVGPCALMNDHVTWCRIHARCAHELAFTLPSVFGSLGRVIGKTSRTCSTHISRKAVA